MAGEIRKAVEFDGNRAESLVSDLRKKFGSGTTRSYEWRSQQLKMLIRMMEEKEKEIIDVLHRDLRKPEMEAFLHEIAITKDSCNFILKNLKKWMKAEKVPSSIMVFPSSAEVVREPLGVVLVISPWNYPFLLAIDPVIGAIAAGNCVVLKPSEISTSTSAFLAGTLPEYVDNSCIKVVEGAVAETTALLEQKWDKIMYTGNGRVGRIILNAATKHLTPVVLELGGKSPVIVASDVDLNVALKRIAVGKWGCNNGQACIAPDYIITTRSFAPTLVEALKEILVKFYGNDPFDSKDLSRIVNSNNFHRLSKLLDDDKVSDKIVIGGQRDEKQLYISPTVLLDVCRESLVMQEEIFGPLLPIILVNKVEDSFDFITSGDKPLAAYVFTKDKKLEEEFVRKVSAGAICVNDTTIHLANSYLPFGGVGESGTGCYHGKYSFETFSHKKAVLRRSFANEAPARYPPYTSKKQKIVKAMINGDILGLILALLGWS